MKNPKDNIFKAWTAKEKQEEADLVREKNTAANMYDDLTYGQENQRANQINIGLKFLCNTASFITGTIALWLVYSFLMGPIVAALLATTTAILFELKKNQYNKKGFKYLLKYQDRSKKIVWPMIGTAIISMVLAIIGAITAPKLNPAPPVALNAYISLDSINQAHIPQIAEADTAAQALWKQHRKPRKGGGWRWSTHKNAQPAKDLHTEKTKLVLEEKQELNAAIKAARAENQEIKKQNKALEQKGTQNHNNNLLLSQVLLVIIAILFEFFYPYLSFEIAYYFLRVDIDNRPELYLDGQLEKLENKSFFGILTGRNQNLNSMQFDFSEKDTHLDDEKEEDQLEQTPKTPHVKTPHVKTPKKLNPGEAICELEVCSKAYKYTRTSQKYCSDDCRKTAHQIKKLQERLENYNN